MRRQTALFLIVAAVILLAGTSSSTQPAFSMPRPAPNSTATATVDATELHGVITSDLWGTNLTQQADAVRTVETPLFVTDTRRIGVTLIRWPGGNNADAYNWKQNVNIRPGRRVERINGVDIARILRFVQDTGTELNVTVNFGTMTARDAADLVEFLNGPADTPWGAQRAALGFPNPLGVRYFEVGNEIGQPHMWYYAWTAEDTTKYFFGGSEERRGFYNNAGSKAYDPVGAKGDFFKATGGPDQLYFLRFPPARDVRVFGFRNQNAAQTCMQKYRQSGILPTITNECEPWIQVNDLSAQPPDARVFMLDAQQGTLRFGDDIHGRMPPQGSYFLVEYTTYDHDGYLDIIRAMRNAPSNVPIQIGAAVLPFVDGQPITTTAQMQDILSEMDFYVRHQYNAAFIDAAGQKDLEALRQIAADRIDTLITVYGRVAQYVDTIGATQTPGIGVTEWNIFLDKDYWQINRTQMGAVIAAEWFVRLLHTREQLPVLYANQFALGGGNLSLIRSQDTYSIAPMAYVFQGFQDWPGNHIVPVAVQSPSSLAYDRYIPYVNAAAAIDADRRTLRVVLVNNAITETITTTLQITGFVPMQTHLWRLRGDEPLASNDHGLPEIVPEVVLFSGLPASLALSPHSVTFLELTAATKRVYLPFLGREVNKPRRRRH